MSDVADPTVRATPSRRAVVAGIWTAPVVVAASTAPAFAASAAATLAIDTFTSYGAAWNGAGNPLRIETKVQVRRAWDATAPDVTSITVSIAFPDTLAAGGKAVSVSGAGWAATSVSGPAGNAYTYVLTWTGMLDNTTQSTPELVFQVKRNNVPATGATLTAYVTSPQATSVARTITTTT